jgi:hypothetical protein
MLTYCILDFNRPIESELCLKSIHLCTQFKDYQVVYLSNGGDQSYVLKYYQDGLIDKLILRKENSGCGLGTRELFNDFDLKSDLICYIQSDQFLCRHFTLDEYNFYKDLLNKNIFFYIDLSGNQGHGNYSERGHIINKYNYQKIPNTIGGPGPFGDEKWTEQSVQEYVRANNLKSYITNPILIADNGKVSRRGYPDGGELIQYTDEKSVFIVKPITKRVDFPNLKLTDSEWDLILKNQWVDGTVPELHKDSSFKCWQRPFSVKDIIK